MNTFIISALAIVSALVTLTTQGLKKILDEMGKTYKSNLLAGIVAIVLSVACVIGYVLYNGIGFSVQIAVMLVTFSFLSWLCAMTSYDKVVQLIKQFVGDK